MNFSAMMINIHNKELKRPALDKFTPENLENVFLIQNGVYIN